MSKNLFVTGTGTDVGKTYVAGLILKKFQENKKNAAYFKAAMSGNSRRPDGNLIPGDGVFVKHMSSISQPLEEMCPYIYETAVSPHLAARLEGNPVDLERVLQCFYQVCSRYEYVTAEGSGGILCPLRCGEKNIWLEDFIRAGNLKCLIVADGGLGTINAVSLTAEYMKSRGLAASGIIFNRFEPGNPLHEDNLVMCETVTGLKVLACVKKGDKDLDLSFQALEALYC